MSSFVCLFFSQYFLLYSVLAMNTNSHLLCVSTFGLKILFFNPTMCIIRITIPNSSCFLSAWYVLYHFHSLLISVIVSDKLHISNVLFFLMNYSYDFWLTAWVFSPFRIQAFNGIYKALPKSHYPICDRANRINFRWPSPGPSLIYWFRLKF